MGTTITCLEPWRPPRSGVMHQRWYEIICPACQGGASGESPAGVWGASGSCSAWPSDPLRCGGQRSSARRTMNRGSRRVANAIHGRQLKGTAKINGTTCLSLGWCWWYESLKATACLSKRVPTVEEQGSTCLSLCVCGVCGTNHEGHGESILARA